MPLSSFNFITSLNTLLGFSNKQSSNLSYSFNVVQSDSHSTTITSTSKPQQWIEGELVLNGAVWQQSDGRLPSAECELDQQFTSETA